MNTRTCQQRWPKAAFLALCIASGLALLAQNASAQDNNETDNRAASLIVTLEHRSPLTAIEKLQPLLDPRGDIGRIANKLVINTTAANLAELENVLADFDVPARRLVLSIDPSYHTLADNSDRQSMQALEFEQNQFVLSEQPAPPDANDDSIGNESTDVADSSELAMQAVSTVSIETEISGNVAMADVVTAGIDSLSPYYQISMPLGQWVILEPLTQTAATTAFNDDDSSTNASETNASMETPASNAAQAEETEISIAIRVDVLP